MYIHGRIAFYSTLHVCILRAAYLLCSETWCPNVSSTIKAPGLSLHTQSWYKHRVTWQQEQFHLHKPAQSARLTWKLIAMYTTIELQFELPWQAHSCPHNSKTTVLIWHIPINIRSANACVSTKVRWHSSDNYVVWNGTFWRSWSLVRQQLSVFSILSSLQGHFRMMLLFSTRISSEDAETSA